MFHINMKNFHNTDGPNKIELTIPSQLRITKLNFFKKLGKENIKITSQRLNAGIPKRKEKKKRKKKKRSFLTVCFVYLNGHPIADLILKIFDKNNRCLLKIVKTKA